MKQGVFVLIVLSLVTNLLDAQDCPAVKLTDFPPKDLPTPAQKDQLKRLDKESGDYYYGIGVPVDYTTARQLAFMEFEISADDDPFKGAGVLLMIYANGFGVKRNLDLCIRLACANVDAAPAEIEGRMEHLNEMKKKASPGTFDICDDITSGYMMGFCQSKFSRLADVKRDGELRKITNAWSPAQQDASLKLKKASDIFIDTRATFEVDLSGTARAMLSLGEEDALKDEFLTAIKLVDKCAFPVCSEKDFAASDRELNKVYAALMKDSSYSQESVTGAVTKNGIIKTERTWLKYVDAWVKFAAIKCPVVPGYVIRNYFTKQRIKQLKDSDENSQ